MSFPDAAEDDEVEYEERPVSELLAEDTGRPASEFEVDDYRLPPFEEWVPADE